MDGDDESLEERILLDFDLARLDLAAARRALQSEDTAATRQRLGECQAWVDSILDMWNDVLLPSA